VFERACPLHRRPLAGLRCAACHDERKSWLVVDGQGQVVAAGREEFRNLRDPATPSVWLGPSIDDMRGILKTLEHHSDQDPRQERELMELPWRSG
jgi:hypothetical protein